MNTDGMNAAPFLPRRARRAALMCALGLTWAAASPPAGTGSWRLAWSDDFDRLDPARWNLQWPCQKAGEPTCTYPDRYLALYGGGGAVASGGLLRLTTRREAAAFGNKTFAYTSGTVNTAGKRHFHFGYFEARLKPASSPGGDPAFWLAAPAQWPPEIDIAEFAGSGAGSFVGLSLHAGEGDRLKSDGQVSAAELGLNDFGSAFHTYGLLWRKNLLVWYVDGREVRRVTRNVPDEPMLIILSDEVRTDVPSWFGDPARGRYPRTTLVDWVRVWEAQP